MSKRAFDSLLVGFFLALLVFGCGNLSRKREASFDRSPETQAKRKRAIDELIQRGVFSKVDKTSDVTSAWVRPAFYALDFDQKKDVMNIVYGYYCDDDNTAVLIKSASSGKIIGTYSLTLGLEMN